MKRHVPAKQRVEEDSTVPVVVDHGHRIVFTRTEYGMAHDVACVSFSVPRDGFKAFLPQPLSALDILKHAVTRWVACTDEGKECWKQSREDLNIGDLFMYYAGPDMLEPWGVFDLSVIVFSSNESTYYDRHLVNETELHEEDE